MSDDTVRLCTNCGNTTLFPDKDIAEFKDMYCNASLCNDKYSGQSVECLNTAMGSDVICKPFLNMCLRTPLEPCQPVVRNSTLLSRKCHGTQVGNRQCDAYCMTMDAFFDDGDCNVKDTIVALFRALDENRDGVITKTESNTRAWYVMNYTNDDSIRNLTWSFNMRIQECDHFTFQKFWWFKLLEHPQPMADYEAEYLALNILQVGDINGDNELQLKELMTVYNATDLEIHLLERSNGNEPGIYIDNVAHVIESIYAGLDGNDWEMEYGYPLNLATDLFVKFLDFNGDGMISIPYEASYSQLKLSILMEVRRFRSSSCIHV
eukprot:755914-Hanusia_phi.AAC.1